MFRPLQVQKAKSRRSATELVWTKTRGHIGPSACIEAVKSKFQVKYFPNVIP